MLGQDTEPSGPRGGRSPAEGRSLSVPTLRRAHAGLRHPSHGHFPKGILSWVLRGSLLETGGQMPARSGLCLPQAPEAPGQADICRGSGCPCCAWGL